MKSAALALALALAAAPAPAQELKKAAWLVRDQLTSRQSVEKACSEAKAGKLDALLVQVRGRGDAYYASTLVPRAEALDSAPKAFDPLRLALEDCKGMEVIAWINAFLVWSGDAEPKSRLHLVNAHPDWILTDADGRKVSLFTKEERARGWIEGIYADPASEPYRSHLAEVAREIAANYKVGGIHLDFIRYPGPDYGRGAKLGEEFRQRYGIDPRWLPTGFGSFDEKAFLSDETPLPHRMMMAASLLWADMRASRVDEAVRAVSKAVREVRPDVEISAAVFPDPGAAFFEKGQDWRGWMREGLVDAIYPMTYFGPGERVGAQLKAVAEGAKAANPKVRIWAGLGSYIKEADEVAAEAAVAASLAFEGVSLFDLGSARKKGTIRAYADKLPRTAPEVDVRGRDLPSQGGGAVSRAFYRATEGVFEYGIDLPEILNRREAEFRRFSTEVFPAMAARLEKEGISVPPWRESRGIFRYVHPLDPPSKKAEQVAACETVREKAAKGDDFAALAAKNSQDATKAYGGRLGRHYLGGDEPGDAELLATGAGAVTPVVTARNGCWVYKVEAAGNGEEIKFQDADWAIRREAVYGELVRELAGGRK